MFSIISRSADNSFDLMSPDARDFETHVLVCTSGVTKSHKKNSGWSQKSACTTRSALFVLRNSLLSGWPMYFHSHFLRCTAANWTQFQTIRTRWFKSSNLQLSNSSFVTAPKDELSLARCFEIG